MSQYVDGACGVGLPRHVRDKAAAAADAAEAALRRLSAAPPSPDAVRGARYDAAEGVLAPARHERGGLVPALVLFCFVFVSLSGVVWWWLLFCPASLLVGAGGAPPRRRRSVRPERCSAAPATRLILARASRSPTTPSLCPCPSPPQQPKHRKKNTKTGVGGVAAQTVEGVALVGLGAEVLAQAREAADEARRQAQAQGGDGQAADAAAKAAVLAVAAEAFAARGESREREKE